MMDSNDKRWVQKEIERSLNIILSAQAGDNTKVETETIDNLFQGMASIKERPVMHPAGFVSRAAKGIFSIVARMGSGPTNRFVLGHRDKNRPKDLEEGEARMYSVAGYQVVVKSDGVFLLGAAKEMTPLILGPQSTQFFSDLIDLIVQHTHAASGAPPSNLIDFQNLDASVIQTDSLLSTQQGGF